ncbi:hypothetical protein V5799_023010 [Amblyomma americanum]|uniref:Uncharacterized protein n=1 Tax=Amblyomma americanum TaxID=6943 RepID=A0AAQ4FIS2_AMBAM
MLAADTGLDDPAFSENYGEDFMANLIRYQRHGSRTFQAASFRSDAPRKRVGVPNKYFLPDYYYGGATEKALNTGTLGVLAAAILFRGSYRRNDEPVEYAECFAQYARDTLKLPLDKTDWLRHTQTRWSVETAFAARDRDHDTKEMAAMHYLRFARTYCGEEDTNVLPLQFAVRSSENFNRTFECGYKYPVMEC